MEKQLSIFEMFVAFHHFSFSLSFEGEDVSDFDVFIGLGDVFLDEFELLMVIFEGVDSDLQGLEGIVGWVNVFVVQLAVGAGDNFRSCF